MMDPTLYRLLVEAEKAVRAAHDRTLEVKTSFWLRRSLGSMQSGLMKLVVANAGDGGAQERRAA